VAIHANRRVIGVPAHTVVTCIRIRLVRMRRIAGMASIDTGEDCVIRRIDMAIAAARTIVRNPERRMGESCAGPSRGHPGGMAGRARSRIIRGNVIWHACSVRLCIRVIVLMAAIAIGSRKSRTVVAARVTVRASIDHRTDCTGNGRARRQHVRTLQWEPCPRVVKLSI